jgi:hypothetical protein
MCRPSSLLNSGGAAQYTHENTREITGAKLLTLLAFKRRYVRVCVVIGVRVFGALLQVRLRFHNYGHPLRCFVWLRPLPPCPDPSSATRPRRSDAGVAKVNTVDIVHTNLVEDFTVQILFHSVCANRGSCARESVVKGQSRI